MLVIQQNCGKSILHSEFYLYWLTGTKNWKNIQVLTTEQKNIVNEVIVENQKNLTSHLYCMILDLKEPLL